MSILTSIKDILLVFEKIEELSNEIKELSTEVKCQDKEVRDINHRLIRLETHLEIAQKYTLSKRIKDQ